MEFNLLKLISKVNERKARFKSAEQEAIQARISTLLDKNTSFMITEAYKALRTNIIFTLSDKGKGCKKILLTSASPGEGKTTTCLNLSIAFAQTGSKVLIIGADLRKPRIYRHLQIERKNGLSDVLCGLIPLEKAIKHCKDYGIDCITAGQLPPNPVELISSPKMGEVFDELSKMYDYIFIDTPPVTLVADATAMSKYVDGVIVVVRQNYTIHETLERARNSLDFADAKILGYILNDVDTLNNRYGSYRRYGYGKGIFGKGYGYGSKYGYGYGYGNGYGYGYGYGGSTKPEIDVETASSNLESHQSEEESKYFREDDDYEGETAKMDEDFENKMEEETKLSRRKKKKQ